MVAVVELNYHAYALVVLDVNLFTMCYYYNESQIILQCIRSVKWLVWDSCRQIHLISNVPMNGQNGRSASSLSKQSES